ncbi:hypothetical protein GQ457_13G012450 [Hibiscus cannabinus]
MCCCNDVSVVVAPPPQQLHPVTEEKYELWMQVVGRKWPAPARRTKQREAQVAAKPTESCLAGNVALQSVVPSEHGRAGRVVTDEPSLSKNSDVVVVHGVVPSINKEVQQDGVAFSSGMTGMEGLETTSKVAAKDIVVVVPFSLQSDKHVASHIVDEGSKRVLKENNGRPLYGLICIASAKGVSHSSAAIVNLNKKNSKIKRNEGSKQHVATDWAANLSADLSKARSSMMKGMSAKQKTSMELQKDVQWIDNSSFEGTMAHSPQ